MEQDMDYRQKQVSEYKEKVMPFLRYIPWFEENRSKKMSSYYENPEFTEHSIAIPVYDGTLMSFVKSMQQSDLMDRNYQYIYSRNGIRTHEDERKRIAEAQLGDWSILCGILSKYVLGGQVKSTLWTEAMDEGIFLLVLQKMREIVEYWDKPIDVRY